MAVSFQMTFLTIFNHNFYTLSDRCDSAICRTVHPQLCKLVMIVLQISDNCVIVISSPGSHQTRKSHGSLVFGISCPYCQGTLLLYCLL